MNSDTVYQIAKALPNEEQLLLLRKLQKDFSISKRPKKRRTSPISREEATQYLLDNVFKKR